MELLKKIIRKIFPIYSIEIFSQEGEDILLNRYFENKKDGFYIDIGAHHPKRFSNTYFFYKRGWRGVNIDAMPGSMNVFNKLRPRDINIEQAISNKEQVLVYNIYKEKALNTFSNDLVEIRSLENKDLNIERRVNISTKRLGDILSEKILNIPVIDFMSIDVEGLDFEVLESNNWEKFKPRLILIEILVSNFEEINFHPITIFLKKYNYHVFAKCINTILYRHDNELQN